MRAVFLDRDGVINEAIVRDGKPYPPDSIAELRLVAGVERALDQLKGSGFLLMVVTNQPDVARGRTTRENVESMHRYLSERLPLDGVYCCYHGGPEDCGCRKPKPGLLLQAAEEWEIDMSASFMVGDRWRDVDAGLAAGCRTVLIDYGYEERAPEGAPSARVASLPAAVEWILEQAR
ncbi:MAG: HAD family hydrolase [Acidobacteria bacterium]|nr:HAD family hydrolase [Acidobacteriota bacterium]